MKTFTPDLDPAVLDRLRDYAALFTPDFPRAKPARWAGVYLHGLAAQKGEAVWGQRCLFATDLLQFLPEAVRECTRLSDVL